MGSNSKLDLEIDREELIDRIKGCIYGTALGDAVGLSTEFMTKVTARHLYGVGPIKFGRAKGFEFWRDGHRSRWNDNDFTDDTDQTLLIAQSLLENGGSLIPTHFAYRLLEWVRIGFPELGKRACGIGFTVGSVLYSPEFTTEPHKSAFLVWDRSKRNLAANGAVMRTSILGIPEFWNEEKVYLNSINAAKVTHADPRSVASAVIVSVIISRILRGGLNGELEESKVDSEAQARMMEYLLQGTGYETGGKDEVPPLESPKPKEVLEHTPNDPSFLSKFFNIFRKKESKNPLGFPTVELDKSRASTPAKLPNTLPESMDTFGIDIPMDRLCRKVVDDYVFLLKGNPLVPNQDTGIDNDSWAESIRSHCFPTSISGLELDDKKSMGYALKCLGAGIYAATRAQPHSVSPPEFFKKIITELTLEAGDADTNCAVAGALLGCRLGKKHLPKEWMDGIRNVDFLEKIGNELSSLVLSQLYEN